MTSAPVPPQIGDVGCRMEAPSALLTPGVSPLCWASPGRGDSKILKLHDFGVEHSSTQIVLSLEVTNAVSPNLGPQIPVGDSAPPGLRSPSE